MFCYERRHTINFTISHHFASFLLQRVWPQVLFDGNYGSDIRQYAAEHGYGVEDEAIEKGREEMSIKYKELGTQLYLSRIRRTW
jgi:hypothetical protein